MGRGNSNRGNRMHSIKAKGIFRKKFTTIRAHNRISPSGGETYHLHGNCQFERRKRRAADIIVEKI